MSADRNPDITAEPVRFHLTENVEQDELVALLDVARKAVSEHRGVYVDCSAAEFVPTGAMQILFAIGRACAARRLPFTADQIHPSAAAYLRLAGLDAALKL